MSATSAYTYDAGSGRYRASSTGRYVSAQQVHQWQLTTTQHAGQYARQITQSLRDGGLSLADWQTQMMQLVKDTHLSSAIAANGGTAQMTFSDYGRTGQIIRTEYDYLRSLANGIGDGSIPLDGRVLQRAEQYARAGRQTYAQFDSLKMQALGHDEERNVIAEGDNCDGCLEADAAGWVPIGTLPLPGERTCMQNCRCFIQTRQSAA